MKKRRNIFGCLILYGLLITGCKNSIETLTENSDEKIADLPVITQNLYNSELLKVYNYKKQYTVELYNEDVPSIEIPIESKGTTTVAWYCKKNNQDKYVLKFALPNEQKDKVILSNEKIKNDFTDHRIESVSYYAVIETDEDDKTESYKTDPIVVSKVFGKTDIPVMYINVENGMNITSKKDFLNAELKIQKESETLLSDSIEIKGRGRTSWNSYKKSYSIKLSSKQSLFGFTKSRKYILVPNQLDKTLLRNQLAYYLGRNIYTNLMWTPSTQQVHLMLNDEYIGEYLLVEKIQIDENKVDIQNLSDIYKNPLKCKDLNNDGIIDYNDGGFVLEFDLSQDENFGFVSVGGSKMSLKCPDANDFISKSNTLLPEIEEYIVNTFNIGEAILYSNSTPTIKDDYYKKIEFDSFVDYYIVNEFTSNTDSLNQNFSSYIVYDPSIQKFRLGPLWDFDLSMGNYNNANTNVNQLKYQNSRWLKMLMMHSDFRTLVKERWNETKNQLYDAINTYLIEQAKINAPEAELNYKRWDNVLGVKLAYSPEECESRKTYQSEIDYLVNWLNARYEYVDTVFNEF